jgi:hypothetical protein
MFRRRPFGITVLAVVLVAVAAVVWNYFSGPSSSDCAPVRELLAFNKTQTDLLNSKTHIPAQGSYEEATEPSDLDYRNWADGLIDRAAKVTDPDLANQAKSLAQTTDRLVRARIDMTAQTKATAPGAPPPPVAMAVSALYDEFQAEIGQLSTSCPA